jgi:hypothetical protein
VALGLGCAVLGDEVVVGVTALADVVVGVVGVVGSLGVVAGADAAARVVISWWAVPGPELRAIAQPATADASRAETAITTVAVLLGRRRGVRDCLLDRGKACSQNGHAVAAAGTSSAQSGQTLVGDACGGGGAVGVVTAWPPIASRWLRLWCGAGRGCRASCRAMSSFW